MKIYPILHLRTEIGVYWSNEERSVSGKVVHGLEMLFIKSKGKSELRRHKMKKQWLCFVLSISLISVAWGLGGDVTQPGDIVVGVPNNGNWPGGEAPPLAINNDSGTKFLHFNGASEPTGFRVTPSRAQTIVGGMTFTTANDAIERDPMTFELYGSNVSINGPYVLIATGSTYLPETRFALNTSPIEFPPWERSITIK